MYRLIGIAGIGLASLPTVCSGTSSTVEVIDLSDAAGDDAGIVDASPTDAGWLGAACDPGGPDSCDSLVGLSCAPQHTSLPEDVYGTCVFACGTSIEATQCTAWGGKCTGGPDSGVGVPPLGYCLLSDF